MGLPGIVHSIFKQLLEDNVDYLIVIMIVAEILLVVGLWLIRNE